MYTKNKQICCMLIKNKILKRQKEKEKREDCYKIRDAGR